MNIKLTKTQPKDLGVARHQLIPKKEGGKSVSMAEALKVAKDVAKELGYKEVRYYQETEDNYEFRLLSRDKKWKKVI